jgi:hypothetical protein
MLFGSKKIQKFLANLCSRHHNQQGFILLLQGQNLSLSVCKAKPLRYGKGEQ